jgi:hypothetical protein
MTHYGLATLISSPLATVLNDGVSEENQRKDSLMGSNVAEQALYNDLLSIYARAGAEVTYETEKGEQKAYWPKRFLQVVKRAEKKGELIEFVSRLVLADKPSRGFFILKKAGRLDLTVEALFTDRDKLYWGEVDADVVAAARMRLAGHDYPFALSGPPSSASSDGDAEVTPRSIELRPGTSMDVRVTVGPNGDLSLVLV